MRSVSLLGDRAFYVILFPAIYWFWKREDAVRLTAILCTSIFVNFWLKELFQIPRPEGMAEVEAESFAFPSGHAQHAVVLWGFRLKLILAGRPPRMLFLTFLVITSTVALFSGVHYSGIVMGALFGLTTGGVAAGSLNLPSTGISPLRGGPLVILGSAGLYGIYLAVQPIIDSGEGALFLALTAIGLWIALGVPWLADKVLESAGVERRSR